MDWRNKPRGSRGEQITDEEGRLLMFVYRGDPFHENSYEVFYDYRTGQAVARRFSGDWNDPRSYRVERDSKGEFVALVHTWDGRRLTLDRPTGEVQNVGGLRSNWNQGRYVGAHYADFTPDNGAKTPSRATGD